MEVLHEHVHVIKRNYDGSCISVDEFEEYLSKLVDTVGGINQLVVVVM